MDASIYCNGITTVRENYVHDGVAHGILVAVDYCVVLDNISESNSGASTDGISFGTNRSMAVCLGNICYNNGRHGIFNNGAYPLCGWLIKNNILVENGASGTGYGFAVAGNVGNPAFFSYDGNFYYGNATGARLNGDDTGGTNPVNGEAPYTNTLDVILSGNPFNDAPNKDFTLNSTAGAGAACRAAGNPASLPGLASSNYRDPGVFQHQDAGGGGGMFVAAGMDGGMRG